MKNFCRMEIFLIFCAVLKIIQCQKSSKELEGYPEGFWSDCPGSNKTVQIPRKYLHRITMTVQGPGNIGTARKVTYSYNQLSKLAKDPDMNFSRPTALYVPAYVVDYSKSILAHGLGMAYSKIGYNVLHLDISYFTTYYFPLTVRYMKSIGTFVAEMIVKLEKVGLNPKTLEIVGVSLGGQTIGFIAKGYKNLTGTKIAKLVGLDPSGPCFRHTGPEDRLDPSDADFVNVVHTNIDGYGIAKPIGHVNFYVNGGEFQSGDIFFWAACGLFCSHMRSYFLWLVALEHPNSFIGLQCDSVQQARERKCFDRVPRVTNTLGPNTDKNKTGIFYLGTSNGYPYYLGKKGLRKENDFFLHVLNVSDANVFNGK